MSKVYKKPKKQYLTTGVKKIVPVKTANITVKSGTFDNPYYVIVKGDTYIYATVPEEGYYSKTPEFRKGKEKWIYRMLSKHNPNFTQNDAGAKTGRAIEFRVIKRLCGSAIGWVEAFHTYPENTPPNGFYFSGNCPSKITKAEWRWYQEDNKGAKIGGANVLYGDTIQLHIETEGLNGNHVEASFKEDETNSIIASTEGKTFNGYLILNIPIKNVWRSKLFNVFERMGNDVLNITPILSYKNHYTGIKGEFEAPVIKIQNKVREFAIAKGGVVPVTVGKVATNPLKYNPCKYTKIILKQKKRDDYIFFDEAAKLYGQEKPFQFIAGKKDIEDNRTTISIEGLKTNPDVFCLEKDGHKGHVFEYNETLKKWVKEEKDAELKLEIQYQYPDLSLKGKSISSVLTDYAQNIIMPVEYIWPARKNLVQKYSLQANTCRYSKKVYLEVYPDIEWTIQFFYNTKNPVIYRDTWTNMTQYRVEDAYNKAQAGDIDGYDGSLMMKFGFKFTAKWNGGLDTSEFGTDWSKKIQKFLLYFLKLKRLVSGLVHKNKVPKTGLSAKILQRLTKKPITIEVYAPGMSFDIGWKLQNGKEQYINKVGTLIEGKLKFDPLIGGEGRLDLFAIATKVPAIGQVIQALDLALSVINVDPVFDLKLIGQITAEFNFEFDTTQEKLQKGEGKIEGKLGIKIELSVKASGKVDAIIFKADYSFEAKGIAESYLIPRLGMGADDDGVYIDASVDFTGIKVTLVLKAEFGMKGRSTKLEKMIVEKKENMLGKKYYINN